MRESSAHGNTASGVLRHLLTAFAGLAAIGCSGESPANPPAADASPDTDRDGATDEGVHSGADATADITTSDTETPGPGADIHDNADGTDSEVAEDVPDGIDSPDTPETDSGGCTPKTEICGNNFDDDCDGVADNFVVDGDTRIVGEACDDYTLPADACFQSATWECGDDIKQAPTCVLVTSPITAEICDNFDNDCDGTPDDISTPTTCGIGVCATTGALACIGGNLIDSCLPNAPLATTDTTCDNLDDDCDGNVDDDFVGSATQCGVGVCKASGVTFCSGGNITDTCAPLAPQSTTDATCDNLDNNCNSATDEDYLPQLTDCGTGECASTGVTSCVSGIEKNSCTPKAPTPEICDNKDNNCNTVVDEIAPVATTCGTGVCAAVGAVMCSDGATIDTCTPLAPLAATDTTCDGVDDDCDGTPDDDVVGATTTCGAGACASTGALACVDGHMIDSCQPGDPSAAEVCDGADNNCNGATDEDIVSAPTTCGIGACVTTGAFSCIGGKMVDSCAPKNPPSATDAACDGVDNNCNGATDEDYVAKATTCGVGECASTGVTSCVGGAEKNSCTPKAPTPEICDGKDNNCNGVTDADVAGFGDACEATFNFCKNYGTKICDISAKKLICNAATPVATPEVCADGKDNDCDGGTDNIPTCSMSCSASPATVTIQPDGVANVLFTTAGATTIECKSKPFPVTNNTTTITFTPDTSKTIQCNAVNGAYSVVCNPVSITVQ